VLMEIFGPKRDDLTGIMKKTCIIKSFTVCNLHQLLGRSNEGRGGGRCRSLRPVNLLAGKPVSHCRLPSFNPSLIQPGVCSALDSVRHKIQLPMKE
jgi:hypothetical protein